MCCRRGPICRLSLPESPSFSIRLLLYQRRKRTACPGLNIPSADNRNQFVTASYVLQARAGRSRPFFRSGPERSPPLPHSRRVCGRVIRRLPTFCGIGYKHGSRCWRRRDDRSRASSVHPAGDSNVHSFRTDFVRNAISWIRIPALDQPATLEATVPGPQPHFPGTGCRPGYTAALLLRCGGRSGS